MRALTYAVAAIALCASTAITVAQIKGPTTWPANGYIDEPATVLPNKTVSLGLDPRNGFCWLASFSTPEAKTTMPAVSVTVTVDGKDWKATTTGPVTAQVRCIRSARSAGQ